MKRSSFLSPSRTIAFWLALLVPAAGLSPFALADDANTDSSNTGSSKTESPLGIINRIHWTKGPATVQLGTVAQLKVPAGYLFADATGAALWDEANQNPPDPSEIGVLRPPEDAANQWFVSFSYDDSGYVKDDDKDNLNAETIDSILNSIRTATEQDNNTRRQKGWSTLTVNGWQQQPFYDATTHNLTWAIDLQDSTGSKSTNYDSRVLGRSGFISVDMVLSPEELSATVPTYQSVISNISFNSGQKYEEFRDGDRIAKLGLLGLIAGGAAVAVVKGSAWLLKLGAGIIALLVAGAAAVKRKIARLFGRSSPAVATVGATTASAAAASTAAAATAAAAAQGFSFIKCHVCGQNNRIRTGAATAACGRCKANLSV